MKRRKKKVPKKYGGWIPARALQVIPPKTLYNRQHMKKVREDR